MARASGLIEALFSTAPRPLFRIEETPHGQPAHSYLPTDHSRLLSPKSMTYVCSSATALADSRLSPQFPTVSYTPPPSPPPSTTHLRRWKNQPPPFLARHYPPTTTKKDYRDKTYHADPTLHNREAVDVGNRQLAGRAQRPAAIGEVEQRGVSALSRSAG